MQMKTGILIGLALVLAFATFFLAKIWLDSQREGYRKAATAATKQPQIPTAEILVAKANLPAGTRIKQEHLEWRTWPKKGVVKTHFVKGDKKLEDVLGFIVRRGILAGEPLITGRIVKQGDRGYMAALLDPGMQAVTIKVNKFSAVAGFIKPGDDVDILLTMSIKPAGVRRGKGRQVTETILTKILVIAVESVTNDLNTKPSAGKSITLQVTPKQAQIFTVAKRVGAMSLSLRSLSHEQYVANEEFEEETNSKGKKSGKKGAKDGKDGKVANKESPEKIKPEDNQEGPAATLRTWDSEVSQMLPQIGGRKKKVGGFEIVRGIKVQRVFIVDEKTGKDVGVQAKEIAKKSAFGIQAGQRVTGTAISTLR